MFRILKLCGSLSAFNRELGGDFEIFHEYLKQELVPLLNAGVHVVVYFDGKRSRFKHETAFKRHENKIESWELLNRFSSGIASNFDEENLPVPPCCKYQMLCTLRYLGIGIINCDFEADEDMAQQCASLNSGCSHGEETCFIYGDDT